MIHVFASSFVIAHRATDVFYGVCAIYGEWFFWTWYKVLVSTMRNVLPILNITTVEELEIIGL